MLGDLFQVVVETRKGKPLAVGPKFEDRRCCEPLVAAINANIIRGTERVWSNPHIVTVPRQL